MIRQTTHFFLIGKNLDRYVTKEHVWVADKHMKRYSTSLVIREMNIKTTRYQYTPSKMIKYKTNNNKSSQR